MRKTLKIGACSFLLLLGTFGFPSVSFGMLPTDEDRPLVESDVEPVDIEVLLGYEVEEDPDDDTALPFDIREDALKEAAISFGARGGLAKRTWEIRKNLDTRARYLDKVYDFEQLLVAAPSGFKI